MVCQAVLPFSTTLAGFEVVGQVHDISAVTDYRTAASDTALQEFMKHYVVLRQLLVLED